MNQYVRTTLWQNSHGHTVSQTSLLIDAGLGQQKVQCELQSNYWRRFLDKRGAGGRSFGDDAGTPTLGR